MNVLITGAWPYTAAYLEEIHALGHRVWDMPEESGVLPCDPATVDAVICNNVFAYHPIESFARLRYVQLTSAGVDRVPLAYVREKGIALHNASGVYSIPMAEFALAGVLDLYKQGRYFDGNRSLRRWEKHRGLRELTGKTVCILGCGSVGNECAVRFAAFGCRVIGIDTLPREDHRYEAMHASESLKAWLPSAQILVLCAPLTEGTYHLLDQGALALLPDGAVVVNLSRGAVVDTAALLQAMSERELYAVLDVFEEEPLPPDSPLWDLPNLRLSPHNSFVGEGNAKRLADLILENLRGHGNT